MFDPEAPFWQGMARLADLLMLSLLWLFLSLPLFTLGAATAALYDAGTRGLRQKEIWPCVRFLRTFKREFATATAVTVVWGLVLAALIYGLDRLCRAVPAVGPPLAVASCFALLLVPVGAVCWMFPLLSRFTFRPPELMLTGLRFALGYLPRTAACVLFAGAAAAVSCLLLLPMLVAPCLTVMFWSLMMEPVFRRHMPEEDGGPAPEQGSGTEG